MGACIQFDIKIEPDKNEFQTLLSDLEKKFDPSFKSALNSHLLKHNKTEQKGFWPRDKMRIQTCHRFGLRYKSNTGKTFYSKRDLLTQLCPSLESVLAYRLIFDIPAGQGRILNIDESMHYIVSSEKKDW